MRYQISTERSFIFPEVGPSRKSLGTHEHDALRALVARWRNEAGLSQRELSARLGRPHNFLVKVELGQRGLDVVEALEIVRALGRDPAEFFAEYCRIVSGRA